MTKLVIPHPPDRPPKLHPTRSDERIWGQLLQIPYPVGVEGCERRGTLRTVPALPPVLRHFVAATIVDKDRFSITTIMPYDTVCSRSCCDGPNSSNRKPPGTLKCVAVDAPKDKGAKPRAAFKPISVESRLCVSASRNGANHATAHHVFVLRLDELPCEHFTVSVVSRITLEFQRLRLG